MASYRNMLVIIRDRVQDLIEKGMTLQQVQTARPSLDFDALRSADGFPDNGHVDRGGVS